VDPLEHRTEVVTPNLLGGDPPAPPEAGLPDGRVGAADVADRVCWELRRMDRV
jgi:hypothetical protein